MCIKYKHNKSIKENHGNEDNAFVTFVTFKLLPN